MWFPSIGKGWLPPAQMNGEPAVCHFDGCFGGDILEQFKNGTFDIPDSGFRAK